MPILKFQCGSCGLSSRKRVRRGTDTIKCDCGEQARVESTISASVGFTGKVDQSMKAQTTGFESFDLDFDRVMVRMPVRNGSRSTGDGGTSGTSSVLTRSQEMTL